MITSNDIPKIHDAAAQYGVAIPKPVLAAEALHDAAAHLLEEIRAEAQPDIEAVTVKTLRATHEAMVTRVSWPVRERAAVEIDSTTEYKRIFAWHEAAGGLCVAFAGPFDAAADLFTANLAALDGQVDADRAITLGLHAEHQKLVTAAADLKTLCRVRDALASSLPTAVGAYGQGLTLERLGRIADVPSMDAVTRIIPVRSAGLPEHSIAWFAALAGIDGLTLRWHTPEQQQSVAQLAAHNTAA